jgi:two-component system KDP operon response regulator KdpE
VTRAGPQHVLVIDDEAPFLRALSISLRARGYEVATARTGTDGLQLAADESPDVIVLDLGLPDLDGVEVVRELRGWSKAPVLVLSARHTEAAKVGALDAGADDYVTKPFNINELTARLRAVVRRHGPNDDDAGVVVTPDFTIELMNKRVLRPDGEYIHLTPTEWKVVEILVRNRDKLVTQRQLLHQAWGPEYDTQTDYLRAYLATVRRKLEPEPSRPRYFITEPRMGYRFVGGS